MTNNKQISWPERYEPANCPVDVRNEIAMTSPPEIVWAWLIRAQLWPTWYPNSANIRFLHNQTPDLALGTRFRWKTFGFTIESTVVEFVPYERLTWEGRGFGLDACHAWLIQKTDQGCYIITEETQHGFLARVGKLLMPNQMEKMHQVWLEKLQEKAAGGLPAMP